MAVSPICLLFTVLTYYSSRRWRPTNEPWFARQRHNHISSLYGLQERFSCWCCRFRKWRRSLGNDKVTISLTVRFFVAIAAQFHLSLFFHCLVNNTAVCTFFSPWFDHCSFLLNWNSQLYCSWVPWRSFVCHSSYAIDSVVAAAVWFGIRIIRFVWLFGPTAITYRLLCVYRSSEDIALIA